MRYYLDTEFNGFGGELLSLALVNEEGSSVYFQLDRDPDLKIDPWVAEHVLPIMVAGVVEPQQVSREQCARRLAAWLAEDPRPRIIADWPDDIRHFCEMIILGPGKVASFIDGLRFEWRRVDAYPTTLPGAVQHNAHWDAMALWWKLEGYG